MGSASCEAISRKARRAGNGPVLAKRRHAADDGFTTRPQAVRQTIQAGGGLREQGAPVLVQGAVSGIGWGTLNP
jgi:hypothetical protein